MKKVLLLAAIIAVVFSSCNLMDVLFDYDNSLWYDGDFDRITLGDIAGTVWQTEIGFNGTEYPKINYYDLPSDFDNDGFPEYTEDYVFFYFDDNIVHCYHKEEIHDEGPDITTYPSHLVEMYGRHRLNRIIHFNGSDGPFSIIQGIIVMNLDGEEQRGYMTGDTITVISVDGRMVLTSSGVPSVSELENAEVDQQE